MKKIILFLVITINSFSVKEFLVHTKEEFIKASKHIGEKNIYIENDINFTNYKYEDVAYKGYSFDEYLKDENSQEILRQKSSENQKKYVEIKINSDTKIIGRDNVKIYGANLILEGNNINIENIYFESPYDLFPKFDKNDGKNGE